uniref:Uncharacterized protein n=1 Tax=Geobacter sp. (strain M21) TaxID=443144 RepID=C6E6S4_GEOSM
MIGIQHINKIREYCNYVEEHLLNVEKAWVILQAACKDMNVISDDYLFWNIDAMIRAHDVSKMSAEEFIQYQRYFYPFGEKDANGFDSAWQHHLEGNPHHWQAWTKLAETFPNDQACHCVCMVCDWMAMGMKFNDTAEQYYEKNCDKIELPEWAVNFIGEIFVRLRNV